MIKHRYNKYSSFQSLWPHPFYSRDMLCQRGPCRLATSHFQKVQAGTEWRMADTQCRTQALPSMFPHFEFAGVWVLGFRLFVVLWKWTCGKSKWTQESKKHFSARNSCLIRFLLFPESLCQTFKVLTVDLQRRIFLDRKHSFTSQDCPTSAWR